MVQPAASRRLSGIAFHIAGQSRAPVVSQAAAEASPNPFRLDGKVAFITGGSRHFGFEIATSLASAGCNVVVTSRTQETAEAAAKQLSASHNIKALGLALDVSGEYSEVEDVAAAAIAWQVTAQQKHDAVV